MRGANIDAALTLKRDGDVADRAAGIRAECHAQKTKGGPPPAIFENTLKSTNRIGCPGKARSALPGRKGYFLALAFFAFFALAFFAFLAIVSSQGLMD